MEPRALPAPLRKQSQNRGGGVDISAEGSAPSKISDERIVPIPPYDARDDEEAGEGQSDSAGSQTPSATDVTDNIDLVKLSSRLAFGDDRPDTVTEAGLPDNIPSQLSLTVEMDEQLGTAPFLLRIKLPEGVQSSAASFVEGDAFRLDYRVESAEDDGWFLVVEGMRKSSTSSKTVASFDMDAAIASSLFDSTQQNTIEWLLQDPSDLEGDEVESLLLLPSKTDLCKTWDVAVNGDVTHNAEALKLSAALEFSETRPEGVEIDVSDPSQPQLPETLPATLTLDFETLMKTAAGSTFFEVALPEHEYLSIAETEGELATANASAAYTVKDGKLKVTLSKPASGGETLEPIADEIVLDAFVSRAALAEDEEIALTEWILQTPAATEADPDPAPVKAALALPAARTLLEKWVPKPVGDPVVTTRPGAAGEQAMLTTMWCDNNNHSLRPDVNGVAWQSNLVPYFTIEGDETPYPLVKTDADGNPVLDAMGKPTISDKAKELLYLSSLPTNYLTVIEPGDSITEASTSGLPATAIKTTTISYDDGTVRTETETKKVTWIAIKDRNSYVDDSGALVYKRNESIPNIDSAERDKLQYMQVVNSFGFNIVGKTGDDDLHELVGKLDQVNPEAKLCLHVRIAAGGGYEEQSVDIDVRDIINDGGMDVADLEDTNGLTLNAAGWPVYWVNGNPIEYSLVYEANPDTQAEYADYFQPIYDNAASPNHGAATDAVWPGGTLNLVHVGNTTFNATKEWMDTDASGRGDVVFTLWRYSARPGGSATAVPVSFNRSQVAISVDAEVSQAAAGGIIDLGALLREEYGDFKLDKYDPDGYPYIYALREGPLSNGYERVLGKVATDAAGKETVTDTAPNYYEPGGEGSGTDAIVYVNDGEIMPAERLDGETFIYNTGTVTNRKSGTIKHVQKKTWLINAFQGQLTDVACTFQVQSRVLDENRPETDDTGWEFAVNEKGERYEEVLTDWTLENLTQDISANLPKYNGEGKELEYRWVETAVTQGGGENLLKDGWFTLTLFDADGREVTQDFFSTTYSDDPTTIVNSFNNETDEVVDKWWQPEGADGFTQDPAVLAQYGISSAEATVRLIQDDVEIGSFTMDGKIDAAPLSIDGLHGATYQETSPYHLEFRNLPKYDEEGSKHIYLVLESGTEPGAWHTERDYTPDTDRYPCAAGHTVNLTELWNTQGPGEASTINVTKSWADGNNSSSRLSVLVQLVAKNDIYSAINPDQLIFKSGEVISPGVHNGYTVSMTNADAEGSILITEGLAWFEDVDINIGGIELDDVDIRETFMVDKVEYDVATKKWSVAADSAYYPVCTYDEAKAAGVENGAVNWMRGWESSKNIERVATNEDDLVNGHVYEVTYGDNEVKQSKEVDNRRLGIVDIEIIKEWIDGDDDCVRPAAEVVLYSTDALKQKNADGSERPYNLFSIKGDEVFVTLPGGNSLPIQHYDEASGGRTNISVSEAGIYLEDDEGNNCGSDDGATGTKLVLPIDTKTIGAQGEKIDDFEYEFASMPKFDSNGTMIHYAVEERWAQGADRSEYSSSLVADEYQSSALHFEDMQHYDMTNRHVGSKAVEFYYDWHDVYVNETLGKRPDIYMTLYALQPDGSLKPVKIEYMAVENWEKPDGSAPDEYYQKITISNLPKYDAEGNEIIYYAGVGTTIDYAKYDYLPHGHSYEHVDAAVPEAEREMIFDQDLADANAGKRGWVLREDGTFVFAIDNDMVVGGTKLWSNVPGNVEQPVDLPDITIYLQQRLKVEGQGVDEGEWGSVELERDGDALRLVGDTIVAWTSDFSHDSVANQYTFKMTHYGENFIGDSGTAQSVAGFLGSLLAGGVGADGQTLLPKYNEDGVPYEYRLFEMVNGLADVPGGFNPDDYIGKEVAVEALSALVGKVFTVRHGDGGSFMIENAYSAETGRLTVKKVFDDEFRIDGEPYPDVTFSLYRQYEGADGMSEAALVATQTIAGGDFENGMGKVTFDNLEMYAPNGRYWQYYVVEKAIDGHETAVMLGEAQNASDPGFDKGTAADGGIRSEYAMNDEGTTMVADDDTVDVTFANRYVPSKISLVGEKKWSDYSNVFGLRPDKIEISLSRVSGKGWTDHGADNPIKLQTSDQGADFYLQWDYGSSPSQADSWKYTISNLEQWAPDGTAWRYTVTETPLDESLGYGTNPSSGKVTANAANAKDDGTLSITAITNRLKGTYGVRKNWEDGGDPWGLRPKSATVVLQARAASQGADAIEGTAQDVLAELVGDDAALKVALGDSLYESIGENGVVLDEGNDWNHEWSTLPVRVKSSRGEVYDIAYSVVETKIGTAEVKDGAANSYVVSYEYAADGSNAIVTNTLEPTKIEFQKQWDDQDNAWATRPGTGSEWKLTFYLQRTVKENPGGGADGEWKWISEEHGDVDDWSDDNDFVKQEVKGDNGQSLSEVFLFDNLPQVDAAGNAYAYRVVEHAPWGYAPDGVQFVGQSSDGRWLWTLSSAAGPLVNALQTISVSGTKIWEDYDTGMAPDFDSGERPELELRRSTTKATGGNLGEKATYADGSVPQPVWEKNGDGTWRYTYSDLPRYDKGGNTYYYWVNEVSSGDTEAGFYPVYSYTMDDGSDKAGPESFGSSGTTVDGSTGDQTVQTITNCLTRFALDKLSEETGADGFAKKLNGIELSVVSEDGAATYAVWIRDGSGAVSIKVWPEGTTDASQGGIEMTGGNVGYVVGLLPGDYLIRETGAAPAGHAPARDVSLHVSGKPLLVDGSYTCIECEGEAGSFEVRRSDADEYGVSLVSISIVDPIFRAYVSFAKTLDTGVKLEGAQFDLYRVGTGAEGPSGTDEKIATGIVTDENGRWTSKGSAVGFLSNESDGRATLGEGLLPGSYYFLETDATAGGVLPRDPVTIPFEIQQGTTAANSDHGKVKDITADKGGSLVNEAFAATVTLPKYDTTDNAGIKNAAFKLEYAEGTTTDDFEKAEAEGNIEVTEEKTDENGLLVLEIAKKGVYRLTETGNKGYGVPDGGLVIGTFIVEVEDHRGSFALNDASQAAEIEFAPAEGIDLDPVLGLANDRSTGAVDIAKMGPQSEDGKDFALINGAVFKLELKQADGTWKTVAENLVTGNKYAYDAASAEATAKTEADYSAGRLKISELPWGDYRLVETSPAHGYYGRAEKEFTIARDTAGQTLEYITEKDALKNTPTRLALAKESEDGIALAGAEFEIKPVEGSHFADWSNDNSVELSSEPMSIEVGEDGRYSLAGSLRLIVGDTYAVTETKAPTGFKAIEGSLLIEVGEDGTLNIVGEAPAGYSLNGDGITITAVDEPIDIVLKKADTNGNALLGATFTISGVFSDSASGVPTTHAIALTKADAYVIKNVVVGNTYTIAETTVPDGYEKIPGKATFTVSEDGTVTFDGEASLSYGMEVEGNTVTVTAKDPAIEARIFKVDEADGATPLAGAVFKITGAFVDGSTEKTVTTKDDGYAEIESGQLKAGEEYAIEEVQAPAGYELAGRATFTVDERGVAAMTSDAVGGNGTFAALAEGGIAVIKATNVETEITIRKTDDEGAPLAGAEFTALAADGSHEIRAVTDEDGTAALRGLVAGVSYTLAETKAPAGYKQLADTLSFNVLTDGTIVAEGEVPAAYLIGDGSISISVVNEPTSMRMAKAASDGAPLAGAEFVIAPAAASSFADGAHAHTLVSGEDGSTETLEGALVVGDVYTVTETKAPAGYELISGSLTFGVNADGSLQVLGAAPLGYSLVDGGVAIAATDAPIEAAIRKIDAQGEPLAGAEFELAPAEGYWFADGTAEAKVIAVGESGTATLGKANLVAGSEYLLRETEAPEGYQRIEGMAAFTVAADGTVSLASDSPEGYEIDTDGATIVVTNESGLPGLTKTNDSMGKAAAVCAALAVISVACAAASGLHGFRRRRS